MKLLEIIYKSLSRAVTRLIYDGGMAIASNVALSLLLALFPFLMLIASLVRLYGDPSMAEQIIVLIMGSWPGDSAEAITEQLRVLLSQNPSEFFSLSTLVALVLATNGEESARDWPGADWPIYQNYVDAVRYGQVDRYLANSFIYAVLITTAQLFFNILAAYAFARMALAPLLTRQRRDRLRRPRNGRVLSARPASVWLRSTGREDPHGGSYRGLRCESFFPCDLFFRT